MSPLEEIYLTFDISIKITLKYLSHFFLQIQTVVQFNI